MGKTKFTAFPGGGLGITLLGIFYPVLLEPITLSEIPESPKSAENFTGHYC
jgi:hypothetical protein